MKELSCIQTSLHAPKSQYNKFGNYNYRSCEDILKAVKPLLEEYHCQLILNDDIVQIANRIYIKASATITNESGESVTTNAFAREEDSKKGMDGSQITGAASSYARKYALNGLFCIDDNKDFDSNELKTECDSRSKGNNTPPTPELAEMLRQAQQEIQSAEGLDALKNIYAKYEPLQRNQDFLNCLSAMKLVFQNK